MPMSPADADWRSLDERLAYGILNQAEHALVAANRADAHARAVHEDIVAGRCQDATVSLLYLVENLGRAKVVAERLPASRDFRRRVAALQQGAVRAADLFIDSCVAPRSAALRSPVPGGALAGLGAVRRARRPGVRNRPLDKTHHPFKRSTRIGPGPRQGGNVMREDWECDRLAKYKQRCVYVGPIGRARGRVKIVKVKPDWKADYNREYWDHLVRESTRTGRSRFENRARPGYSPRRRGKG